jgi:hypothetical protein
VKRRGAFAVAAATPAMPRLARAQGGGGTPAMYRTPHGFFCPDTPMASDAGLEPLRGPRDLEKAKRMLREAAMLGVTDYAQFKAIGEVAAPPHHG